MRTIKTRSGTADHLWYHSVHVISSHVVVPGSERMARKPSDMIQIKIRVREDLRRRLEQAAHKADRSINSEMASRLADSFNLPKLNEITAGLENVYTRFARELLDRSRTEALMRAVE